MVEVLNRVQPFLVRARVSQCMVEVLVSRAPYVPSGGGAGRWFSDLWDEQSLYDEEGATLTAE